MGKELLFSITKKDLKIDTFRVSGAGGQHRDKTSSGVRITHMPSGAVGQATESRSQAENRELAFARLSRDPKLQQWIRVRASEMLYSTQRVIDKQMKQIKVEVIRDGKWVEDVS